MVYQHAVRVDFDQIAFVCSDQCFVRLQILIYVHLFCGHPYNLQPSTVRFG